MVTPKPSADAGAPPVTKTPTCDATFDVRALLERHARAYGGEAEVAAALPVVLHATTQIGDARGPTEVILGREHHRIGARVASLAFSRGVDAKGAWMLGSGSGVTERLRDDEATVVRLEGWFFRRHYLRFDTARDKASCVDAATSVKEDGPAADRVDVTYDRADIGSPTAVFDLASGALLALGYRQPDGRKTLLTIEGWLPAAAGVRWPKQTTDHRLSGVTNLTSYDRVEPKLACHDGPKPLEGTPCLDPPADTFTMRFPASGRVRVPMTMLLGHSLVRASAAGRPLWALLDSGAALSIVDDAMPAAASFKPTMDMAAMGSTQGVRVGVGTVPTIDIGELHTEGAPTARVAIPGNETAGSKRAEIFLGYSFFAGAAVRLDFKRGEVVFAKSVDGLPLPTAKKVPLRLADGKVLVEGEIEGKRAPFLFDTGSNGTLNVFKGWASANGIPPDGAKTLAVRGKFGVGAADTHALLYRIGTGGIGPIRADGVVAQIDAPSDTGDLAGLAGNGLLARCDAATIDVAGRALWIEGPCDKPVAENRAGWRFASKPDAAHPDKPWVLAIVVKGTPADKAGLQEGDRLLEVAGVAAGPDMPITVKLDERPKGTKVKVVYVRPPSKEAKTTTFELAPLL